MVNRSTAGFVDATNEMKGQLLHAWLVPADRNWTTLHGWTDIVSLQECCEGTVPAGLKGWIERIYGTWEKVDIGIS